MSSFPIHSIASAPQKSVAALEQLHAAFGTIPAIAGVIAASPVLLNGFVAVFANVHSGSLSEAEIQTLLLTNAVTNRCEWAVAFHTGLALQQGVPRARRSRHRSTPTSGTRRPDVHPLDFRRPVLRGMNQDRE